MKSMLIVAMFTATAAECCNPANHAELEQRATRVAMCVERGGIPLTEIRTDDSNHRFEELKGCIFPCDARGPQPKIE